jgi:hypothetical protein
MSMPAYNKKYITNGPSEDEGDETDKGSLRFLLDETEEEESDVETKGGENSDATENESETEQSLHTDEDVSESEEDEPSFFGHIMENLPNLDSLTQEDIIEQLVKNTQVILELQKLAKNDTMLAKIVNKVKKYTKLGLKYDDAMMVVFEKETPYFNNLYSRIYQNEE